MIQKFGLFLVLISVLCACQNDKDRKLDFDVSEINVEALNIKRYEQALFNIDTNNFYEGLLKIQDQYKVFLGEQKISKADVKPLLSYVSNPDLIRLNKDVQSNYPDISFLEEELKSVFQYYLHYYPKAQFPEVYTYVSGLFYEHPIQISSDAMIIGLDLYLGKDYQDYKDLGIPVYKAKRMNREHIAIDCVKELALLHQNHQSSPKNFLEEIIQNAKTLYFTDALLPQKADHLKIGFTEEQLQWCKDNEANIWAFFIDKQLLYSANYELTRKFIQDGPFTHAFSKDAPAGIGNWIGWQIIRSYMNKNQDISLLDLMLEADAQKILKNSSYKPQKK